uniref:Aminotransferase-like plant mobile domain-containing protein n=1 Tax=Setaria italica TaxID=4555 RepID=K4AIR8_SETIT
MVELHIGIWPPELEEGDEEKKTSRVSSAWSREQFSICPQGADEEVVERHARVWLWHFVSDFLPTDAAGNTMSWMVLPLLGQNWDNIRGYSWGSAVLAWLYKQLCDACRRTAKDANLGGCAYLLQIWIWERISYAEPVHGPPARRYKFYTNELDCVTQTQRAGPYKEYLRWYYGATRTRIKQGWMIDLVENPPSDDSDDIANEYDTMTRLGTQAGVHLCMTTL